MLIIWEVELIRRIIEYIIICDCERVFGYLRCDGSANGFNCLSLKDCEQEAKAQRWKQLSKRIWLSPQCAELWDRERLQQ